MLIHAALFLVVNAALSANGSPGPLLDLSPFSKRLSDGSTLLLDNSRWSDRLTKCKDSTGAGLTGLEPREYEYHHTLVNSTLVKVKGAEREPVWTRQFDISAFVGIRPRFIVEDAALVGNKLYILYAFQDGYSNLVLMENDVPGRWSNVRCWRLDDKPRSLAEWQVTEDSGKVTITCFNRWSSGSQQERWDLVDNRLLKWPPAKSGKVPSR